jgi:hypothetical protein
VKFIVSEQTITSFTMLDGSTRVAGDTSAFFYLLFRPFRFPLSLVCWPHADEQLSLAERTYTPPHFLQIQKLFHPWVATTIFLSLFKVFGAKT